MLAANSDGLSLICGALHGEGREAALRYSSTLENKQNKQKVNI